MSNASSIRIISRSLVSSLLPMSEAISLMNSAFSQVSSAKAHVPIRTHLHLEKEEAEALFMPVYLPEQGQTGLKMVNINHRNPERNLPYIQAMMLVSDAQTGKACGLMDAASITAIRTGAASGLATQLLAKEDANVLAVFGTGGQAFRQIEAVMAVRPIKQIWIFGRNREKGEAFAKSISEQKDVACNWSTTLDNLKTADIICTATTSLSPLFSLEDLKPGVHINGIGAYRPDMAEIPAEVVANSKVYVDQMQACLKEAGDIIQAIEKGLITQDKIIGELGELVLKTISGRENKEEITLFKSVGNAAQDLVCATYILAEAERNGVGVEVEI